MEPIDFQSINNAALNSLAGILERWLPDGKCIGNEYVALNPTRADRNPGSFRINIESGRWADFAVEGARGGDPVSLAAYIFGTSQGEAAKNLASMLGMEARR